MKKFLSVFLTLVLLCSMSVTTFATEPQVSGMTKTVKNEGYTFVISERTDESNRVIRSYENNNASLHTAGAPDLNKTKALLVALGMQQEFADNLSTETLQEFAEGEQIIIATSYTKTDKDNNVTYLKEAAAIQAANALKTKQDEIKLKHAREGAPISPSSADYDNYFQDSYMRVDYAVTYKGNGQYLYSVDSRWLTMPFFRGWDSLGACAMDGTVTPNTQAGYYLYDITYNIDGNITRIYDEFNWMDNYENAVNGNWYGSAGYFNLPNDAFSEGSSITYDNFRAHFQYNGHVTSPSQPLWFNTVGNYNHSIISIGSPSVSISLAGSLTAAVGVNLGLHTEVRGVEFEVYYTP